MHRGLPPAAPDPERDVTRTSTRTSTRTHALAGLGALALLAGVLAPAAQVPASAETCDLAGGGTAASPYVVTNADDLAKIGGFCALDAVYRQSQDIDLADLPGNWIPIGNLTDPFEGDYDGQGFAIAGLVVTAAEAVDVRDAGSKPNFTGGGLFGLVVAPSIIRGVRLVDVDVTGDFAGALVANLGGTVEHSSSSGTVTSGTYETGGLVGQTEIGALIRYSSSTATVSGPGPGGLVGVINASSVKDSYATGSVTATGLVADAGGLVAYAGLSDDGQAASALERVYASGTMTDSTSAFATLGGLTAGDYAPPQGAPLEVTASYWDRETTGVTSSGGSPDTDGLTTEAMTSYETFRDAGWPIVPGTAPFDPARGLVWGIWVCESDDPDFSPPNGGYPFLLWETHLWEGLAESCPAPIPTTATEDATPTFLAAPDGTTPSLPTGTAVWQQADGTPVPLAVSSPAPGQVRYEAEGVTLTLTGAAGTDASRGLVANAAGEVECEICATLASGGVIEAWMFSEPRLVAAWRVEDLPCQRFTIPVVAPLDGGGAVTSGAHTLQLALPTASGMQAVNVGVTVGGPVPASVPAGEGPAFPVGLALLAVGLLAFGLVIAGAVGLGRRSLVAI
jgi:hypothetical protein